MNLVEAYHKQFARRPWSRVYELLPPLDGATILDLGCGPGDQAADFVAKGAGVIGVDLIDELLDAARARNLPDSVFIKADLRQPVDIGVQVDGIWGGFIAAYFTDLGAALARWKKHLRAGGWIVLIEIDDLFGHEPLTTKTASLLKGYAAEALAADRYDFYMGRKLHGHLQDAGFQHQASFALVDPEFSCGGAVSNEIVEAWRFRFDVMSLLRDYCGDDFESVRRDFLDCLRSSDHRCTATVQCCVARLPESAS